MIKLYFIKYSLTVFERPKRGAREEVARYEIFFCYFQVSTTKEDTKKAKFQFILGRKTL